MPCSCFGKKDKKVGAAAAAEDKYSLSHEQEPLSLSTQTPDQTQVPAPSQAEPTTATPSAPNTPTMGGDARLRPEDDPDKASRRRDVVASFYSDQCELIGFKATGSRPPSAVVGNAGEGPAATSSPLGSPPSSSRSSAMSRADLAIKRREFFKDLAVNDMNSSRYRASQPSWRMVDSDSLTTPRRTNQHDGPQHHTLPFQARAGGIVLRPVSTPPSGAPGPDARFANGDSEHSHEQWTDDSKVPEGEPLLDADPQGEPLACHPEAGAEEPLLSGHHSGRDQWAPDTQETPPVTPVVPPADAEAFVSKVSNYEQPLGTEAHTEPAGRQAGGSASPPPLGESVQLMVQQQYVQQVSVPSDDERVAEGSCILIKEAFPEEHRSDMDTQPREVSDTTNASGTQAAPPPTHEAARDVSQHSREQPTAPPQPTESPCQRRPSFPREEEEEESLPRYTDGAILDTEQDAKRPTSSAGEAVPGSSQEHRHLYLDEAPAAAAPPEQQNDPPSPQQESLGSLEDASPGVTIVGCIPKAAPTEEGDPRPPSPPHTPPSSPSPFAEEVSRPPAPPTPPTIDDPAPPSPPSLSEPGMTCGVDASSSPLEDDGLGSDIDDALSSLECLSEEGNSEKRVTAST